MIPICSGQSLTCITFLNCDAFLTIFPQSNPSLPSQLPIIIENQKSGYDDIRIFAQNNSPFVWVAGSYWTTYTLKWVGVGLDPPGDPCATGAPSQAFELLRLQQSIKPQKPDRTQPIRPQKPIGLLQTPYSKTPVTPDTMENPEALLALGATECLVAPGSFLEALEPQQ